MTIQQIKQKIQETALPILERRGAFLLDVSVRFERGTRVVQVFADTDRGITVDECADISRELSREIATASPFGASPYQLEISSPGIDRPLKLLRQYQKNVGRRFRVKFAGANGPAQLTGTLVSVVDDQITFQEENGEAISLPFDQILESKEELPW